MARQKGPCPIYELDLPISTKVADKAQLFSQVRICETGITGEIDFLQGCGASCQVEQLLTAVD